MISKKMAAVQTFFLRLLLLMIKSCWFWKVKFGTEIICNIFTYYMQNSSPLNYLNIRQCQFILCHCYIFCLKIMDLDQFIFPC